MCYHSLTRITSGSGDGAPVSGRDARRRRELRGPSVLPRLVLLASVLLPLVLGQSIFGWFSPPPAPLPLPSSTARSVTAGPASWPTAGGDLQGTRSTSASPAIAGTIVWRQGSTVPIVPPLIADSESLYFARSDGQLVAVAVGDGRERWALPLGGAFDAAPTVAGGLLFAGLRDGRIVAVDTDSGALVWERTSRVPIATSPLVIDGVVYALASRVLLALDAADGSRLWEQELGDQLAVVPPVVEGDRLVAPTFSRVLFFDLRTGERTFHLNDVFFPPGTSVAISGDRVFAAPRGRLLAFDRAIRRPWWDGIRAAWTWANIVGIAPEVPWSPTTWGIRTFGDTHPLAVGGDRVFLASAAGTVQAFDVETGASLWRRNGPPIQAGPMITSAGLLLLEERALALVDPSSGDAIDRRTFSDAELRDVIVTTHGTYVLTADSTVIALR